MLALFNLLPIYPLDGYNFIATLLPRCIGYQKFMIKWGQIIIFVIVALGIVGRYTNIPWLDLFGSYDDLIIKLLNKVEIASIKFYWGS
jgi:Zn-dependent protease